MLILRLLCEGNSLRSTSRITGCHLRTITRLIRVFGHSCRNFLDDNLRDLSLRHVEVDEIWTFVQKKQSRLTTAERATRQDIGDIYLWTVLDADTKLLVSHVVGKRLGDMARRLMSPIMGTQSSIEYPEIALPDASCNSTRIAPAALVA